MSILNVDKIQPIGGGSTITVDATDIQASTGTITANSYTGVDNTLKVSIGGTEYVRTHSTGQVSIGSTFMWRSDTVAQVYGKSPDLSLSRFNDQFMIAGNETSGAINTGAGIQFFGHDGVQQRGMAYIRGLKENGTSGDRASYLAFATRINGGTLEERLRIKSDGNVGINSTAPRGKLDIQFDGAPNFITFGSDADNPKVEFFRHTGGSPSHYATEIQMVLGDLVLSTAAIANLGSHSYTEKLRINSGGRVIIGHSQASGDLHGPQGTTGRNPFIQLHGANTSNAGLGLISWKNSAGAYYAPTLYLAHSGSDTKGTNGILPSNGEFGSIVFSGDDGTDFVKGAMIKARLDGSPGNDNMPGMLQFYTNSGSDSPTERLRITSGGHLHAAGITTSNTGFMFGTDGQHYLYESASDRVSLRITSNGPYAEFKDVSGDVQMGSASGTLRLSAGGVEKLRINTNGNFTFYNSAAGWNTLQRATVSNYIGLRIQETDGTQRMQFGVAGTNNHIVNGAVRHDVVLKAYDANLILATNADERLRIDSSGNVTKPDNFHILVDRDGNQTGYSATFPGDVIAWNRVRTSESSPNASNHFNTSTGIFTAPVTGLYHFHASVNCNFNCEGGWIVVNGSRPNFSTFYPNNTMSADGHLTYHLTSGDEVGLKWYDNGNTNATINSNALHTWWRIVLLG